jgi:hypothetical protein
LRADAAWTNIKGIIKFTHDLYAFFDASALTVPELILKRFEKLKRTARAPTDSAAQSHVSSKT